MTVTPDDLIDARQAWALGVPLSRIARHLGISEAELRHHLELPAEPQEQGRQRRLFTDDHISTETT